MLVLKALAFDLRHLLQGLVQFTKLASKSMSARVLQELAGHKRLRTTQRYIDVNDDMVRKAVEVF